MFSLFNNYHLSKLLKKVQWNARAMFMVYAFFIIAGIISVIFMVNGILEKLWPVMLVAIMITAMLILIAPFLLYDYFRHKYRKCSLFLQDSLLLEMWDLQIRQSERIGGRLGVSNEYIFSACSSFYIPSFFAKDAIKAVYSRRYYRKGRLLSDPYIYVICRNGKLYKLPMGGKMIGEKGGLSVKDGKQALDEWILSRVHAHMPHVLFGLFCANRLTKNPADITPLNFNISEYT